MANPDHSKGVKSEKFTGTYFKRLANQIKYWLNEATNLELMEVQE